LVDALVSQGAQVRVLVRSTSDTSRLDQRNIEQVVGEFNDSVALARALQDIDVVFHLAALTRARAEPEYTAVNSDGTRALVAAMRNAPPRLRRFVYVSSLAAAGPATNGVPVGPTDPPRPITAYGRSKLKGEQACLAAVGDLEILILRPPAVYGPRDRDLFFSFQLAMRGILPVPAGPERHLQFIHVHDLVEAMLRAATAPDASGIYHVAESQAYSWSEVGQWIAHAVGCRVRTVRVPHWGVRAAAMMSEWGAALRGRATIFNREKVQELLAPGWLCETEGAKRDLGFAGRIPLPTGLSATAAWYREQGWLS
jgi:nucleoside-diphosphate-sugar epimerase